MLPKYKYSAVSMNGKKVNGEYVSADESGVVAMLRQGGFYPVSMEAVAGSDERGRRRKKIKVKPLAALCSQMSAMLRAGVPIAKTLEILKSQTEDKPLRHLLEKVYTAILRGSSLSEALSPYTEAFPAIFMNMVEAGEASGTLDACLERAGISFSRAARLNNKVRNAMIYPTIIFTVLLGLIILMMVFVIPAFTELYAQNGNELPGFTQWLVNVSNFVIRHWYLLALIVLAAVAGIRAWLASEAGRTEFDRWKFKIPVIQRLLNKIYAARYTRTLSSLSSAGVALPQALTVTARSVINRYIEKELYKVVEAINRGEELSVLLDHMGLLPPMISYLTRLGEESGTLDTLLAQAADFYDEESDSALQALITLLEPALIILMALIVVPTLVAVVLPMFNMYSMLMF